MVTLTSYSKLVALVIDDVPGQVSTLRGQLTLLGIDNVDQASGPEEALRRLRARQYDLVLCDYNLNHPTDGQQLLEYLRDHKLQPLGCLFFMITAESGYAAVANASESKPDAYLLKPFTASDLEDRLKLQLDRQHHFATVTRLLSRQELPEAIATCDTLIARKDKWAMQALQMKAQTLLQLGRHEDGAAIYRSVLEREPAPMWARLGLARALKAAGRYPEALEAAREIVETPEGKRAVGAYDVIAESLQAQGDAEGAQGALGAAAVVVPSPKRHRLLGEMAYRNGDLATARSSFSKVSKSTRQSVTGQPEDTLWLAQTLVDLGEPGEALALLKPAPGAAAASEPGVEAAMLAITAQAHARNGQTEQAAKAASQALEKIGVPRADFSTIAVAKAQLGVGEVQAGMALVTAAISADHQDDATLQLAAAALRDTGHADLLDETLRASRANVDGLISDAKRLFRNGDVDAALARIADAVQRYPENTGLLIEATQMNCLTLRIKKQADAPTVARVQDFLLRLNRLLPSNDRVKTMHRYFRETLQGLAALPA